MKQIMLIDTTLQRAGEMRKSALSFKEKLEIATCLDRLHVDVIELPPVTTGKADLLFNKTFSATAAAIVSASVEITEKDLDAVWESVQSAAHPRLNVIVPSSPVQMEYTSHMKAPVMLEAIRSQIAACREKCADVEFTAVDATRAEPEFLYQAIGTAISAGASSVTLCDTAGILLPDEFIDFLGKVYAHMPALKEARLNVQISDEMSMAAACTAAAISAGAIGVKCTAIPTGCTTLSQVARLVQIKGAALDIGVALRTTELTRAADRLDRMVNARKAEPIRTQDPANSDLPNVTLSKNDEIGEVVKVLHQLGYDLTDEDDEDNVISLIAQHRFVPILNIFGPKATGKSEMAVTLLKLLSTSRQPPRKHPCMSDRKATLPRGRLWIKGRVH